MEHSCPLCNSNTKLYYSYKKHVFYKCNTCKLLSRPQHNIPNLEEEKTRYDTHNNNEHTEGYKKFVQPIVEEVTRNFEPNAAGLDFGSGPSSIIIALLEEQGFECSSYDLFYKNDKELLEKKYDYITACEVIEHFQNPYKEFKMLKNMLHAGGKLFCKTDMYTENLDFKAWYYKNDPTHVIIFYNETFEWIKNEFGFSSVNIEDRVISFRV